MDWKEVRKQAMEERPGRAGMLGTASIMGLHMVTGPAVGAGLGWLADSWLGSFPWGAGIGLFFGIAAGVRNVWVDARWLARAEAASDADKQTSPRPSTAGTAPRNPSPPLPLPGASSAAQASGGHGQPGRAAPKPDRTPSEDPDSCDFGPASLLSGTDGSDSRHGGLNP